MDSWVAGGVLLQYFALSTISFPDDICSNFSDHPLIIEIILRQHEIFPNLLTNIFLQNLSTIC